MEIELGKFIFIKNEIEKKIFHWDRIEKNEYKI